MKRFAVLYWLIILCIAACVCSFAAPQQKVHAIGMRANYWPMPDRSNLVRVSQSSQRVNFEIEGFGATFFFTSRLSNKWLFEFNFGGVTSIEGETEDDDGCCPCTDHENNVYVDAESIIPLLFGVRYQLFSPTRANALQPYLSAGAGPYFFTKTQTIGDECESEVYTETRGRRGAYAGAGFDCSVLDWLGFNFDIKYHFIDFDMLDKYSNWQYGVGMQIMFGDYEN